MVRPIFLLEKRTFFQRWGECQKMGMVTPDCFDRHWSIPLGMFGDIGQQSSINNLFHMGGNRVRKKNTGAIEAFRVK